MAEGSLPRVRDRYATGFYPGDPRSCEAGIERMVGQVQLPDDLPGERLGGLVPHAGWQYSGTTAAYLWKALADGPMPPEVVVLLGAVHVRGVAKATVCSCDSWSTPLGPVELDGPLRSGLLASGGGTVSVAAAAHEGEHSLEVQVPFIRYLLPGVPIVPVQVPADDRAPGVGECVAAAIAADGRTIAVVASSDLTHYGTRYGFAPQGSGPQALAFGRANDRRLVDQALALSAEGVLDEARTRHNACGPGALAAAISAAVALGHGTTRLLHQTTSYDARPESARDASMFVGYASVLFGREGRGAAGGG